MFISRLPHRYERENAEVGGDDDGDEDEEGMGDGDAGGDVADE